MTVKRAEGPQEPDNNQRKRVRTPRPRRGAAHGPLGFGSVMRDVRATPDAPRATQPGNAGPDPAALTAAQLDAGAAAARQMGAVASTEQVVKDASMGIQDAVEALAAQDRSLTVQAEARPAIPTYLGRMTPATMLDTVVDAATKLEIAEAMKELHIELEPADLGPLVVRIRKGPSGTLELGFRAREVDAARMLESGSNLLRDRLRDAGFTTSTIDVEHDAGLRLVVSS